MTGHALFDQDDQTALGSLLAQHLNAAKVAVRRD